MQCILPSQNIKILVRGLHSLSRIGDELYIESLDNSLSFRTVNSAQSAYSSVTFYTSFFIHYKSDFKSDEGGKCKLSMKACLSVFKTPHSMDRNVESCKIKIDEDCVKVSFQIQFVQGYTKNYYLAVADNTNVQLKYSKDEMCNKMNILSKTLYNAIKHFRANDEEITVSVKTDKALLKNYFQNAEIENQKVVRTNLCLQRSEFETYDINLPGSITFALRELRAVCTFSELSNSSPVGIYFEKAGKPVIFSVRNDQLYEADYVVSTLPPEMMSGERPHRRSQLSDVVSTIPSTSTGTVGAKRRKLTPLTEEPEPIIADELEPVASPSRNQSHHTSVLVPRVSLVDIVKYNDDQRQVPASTTSGNNELQQSFVPNIPDTDIPQQSSVRSVVPDTGELQPLLNTFVSNEENQHSPCDSIQDLENERGKTLTKFVVDPSDYFPEDVNNECLQMICDQVDEMTRSQADRIQTVFKYCYNYSPKSIVVPDDQILCESSDIDLN